MNTVLWYNLLYYDVDCYIIRYYIYSGVTRHWDDSRRLTLRDHIYITHLIMHTC